MKHVRSRSWSFVVMLVALGVATLSFGLGVRAALAQDTANVAIVDFAFQPATVEVPVGGTVNWTNTGAANHTVTADDGSFASGELNPGASFSQTFNAVGSFPYFCEIHPQMTGTVNVVDAAAVPAADAEQAAAPEAEQPAAPEAAQAATPAPAAEQPAGTGAATTQLPRSGIGIAALDEQGSGLAVIAALVALSLGSAAAIASRRA